MNANTKLSDLTVAEFKALMTQCLRKHEDDMQFAKWNGLYPDEISRMRDRYNQRTNIQESLKQREPLLWKKE